MKIEKVAALTELRFNWRRPVCESTRPLPRRAVTLAYGVKVTKRRGSEAVNMVESVNERELAPHGHDGIYCEARNLRKRQTLSMKNECCAQAAGYSLLCHRQILYRCNWEFEKICVNVVRRDQGETRISSHSRQRLLRQQFSSVIGVLKASSKLNAARPSRAQPKRARHVTLALALDFTRSPASFTCFFSCCISRCCNACR